jgi:uncharacterized protein YjbI with pentapeptide repeats
MWFLLNKMFKLLALLLGTAHAGTYMDIDGLEQILITTSGEQHTFSGNLRPGANLINANLMFADLAGADLTGADLSGADLFKADFVNANLANSNLQGAYLIGADLSGAYLNGADLSGADFGGFSFGSDITVEGELIQCPSSRQELRSAMNDKSC